VLTLYAHVNRLNANALKVRAALAEAGVPHQYVAVDLARGAQRSPEFLALNPHGKVPVLVDGDFVLPESDAILWYIGESYPGAGLLPASVHGRARTLEWCAFTSTALYPAYYDLYFHSVGPAPDKRIPAVAEGARERLARSLRVLEQALAARDHLAGAYSLADISAAAVVHSIADRLPADYRGYLATERWFQRVTTRPAWRTVLAPDGASP
jgi:glutathione S-transferase